MRLTCLKNSIRHDIINRYGSVFPFGLTAMM